MALGNKMTHQHILYDYMYHVHLSKHGDMTYDHTLHFWQNSYDTNGYKLESSDTGIVTEHQKYANK